MFKSIIRGKVFKVGYDIDTDQIYPGRYLYLTSPEEMAVHAMEDVVLNFYRKIEGEEWIVVSGKILAVVPVENMLPELFFMLELRQ